MPCLSYCQPAARALAASIRLQFNLAFRDLQLVNSYRVRDNGIYTISPSRDTLTCQYGISEAPPSFCQVELLSNLVFHDAFSGSTEAPPAGIWNKSLLESAGAWLSHASALKFLNGFIQTMNVWHANMSYMNAEGRHQCRPPPSRPATITDRVFLSFGASYLLLGPPCRPGYGYKQAKIYTTQ
jgi:hypothetical protein